MENTIRRGTEVTLENIDIIWKNFSGKRWDDERKNFFIRISDVELANELIDLGFGVKPLENRDEEELYKLKVNLRFDKYPPKIYLMTEGNETRRILLNEDSVGQLDDCYILSADVTLRLGHTKKTNTPVAYLKQMYIIVERDLLAEKYDRLYSE